MAEIFFRLRIIRFTIIGANAGRGPDELGNQRCADGIGRQIVAPDLSAQGFMLVGGRVLPPIAETGTGPAAQIMYQNATASRVTLYITAAPASPGKASENGSAKGVEAYYWADKNITCPVSATCRTPSWPP